MAVRVVIPEIDFYYFVLNIMPCVWFLFNIKHTILDGVYAPCNVWKADGSKVVPFVILENLPLLFIVCHTF